MTSFRTKIDIPAAPAEVWGLLVQADRWPDWDDQLESVEVRPGRGSGGGGRGSLGAGSRVTLRVRGQSRPFRLRVATWEPSHRLVLRGGMPLRLFTGTRRYELRMADGGTRFSMEERFTGPLAPLIARSIPDLQPSFDAFAAGLRDAAGRAS